jgi:hypothetical protein
MFRFTNHLSANNIPLLRSFQRCLGCWFYKHYVPNGTYCALSAEILMSYQFFAASTEPVPDYGAISSLRDEVVNDHAAYFDRLAG